MNTADVEIQDNSPIERIFRFMTYWGTIVYFDNVTNAFRHGTVDVIPNNVTAHIKDGKLVITISGPVGEGASNTEIYSLFRQNGDIAFHRDDLYASAAANGQIIMRSTKPGDSEFFAPVAVPITDPPELESISNSQPPRESRRQARPIKLFWWKPGTRVNLGDEISSRLVAAVSGREVIHAPADTAELFAVGSILNDAFNDNRKAPTYIWGSGHMAWSERVPARYVVISALRGPLTRACITRSTDIALGDPGLLTSCVWKPASEKKYSWGIIPHFTQRGLPVFKSMHLNTPNSVVIDLTDPDVDATIKLMTECDFIVSSSLHGLIIADSYAIPNLWVRTPTIHWGNNFKFYDYFCSIGRPTTDPAVLKEGEGLASFEASLSTLSYFSNIPAIQKSLVKNFPEI